METEFHNKRRAAARFPGKVLLFPAVVFVLLIIIQLIRPEQDKNPLQVHDFEFPFGQIIDLEIDANELGKLSRQREKALQEGVLMNKDEAWVKAVLTEGGMIWPLRLRLKGDWTDHLEGKKWSFRAEVRKGRTWRGLHDFSLLSPERRNFLYEWFFHKTLERENLLSTRYDYILLRLNGKLLGAYAVEEHFGDELLQSHQRREGPIVRIDESGMWYARSRSMSDSAFPYLQTPYYQAAAVRPFHEQSTLGEAERSRQFEFAHRLLRQYQELKGIPSRVFDILQTAKQYALIDLFSAYHALIWHNRRFYFNPITQKLEPVSYDCYQNSEGKNELDVPFMGYRLHGTFTDNAMREETNSYFFRDPEFLRAYYASLERFCSPGYVDSLLKDLGAEIRTREKLLCGEYLSYRFDESYLRTRASNISQVLRDGLSPERFQTIVETSAGGAYQVSIQNHNPLPVELWLENDSLPQWQLLEADCGQDGQAGAVFVLQERGKISYRLPGCKKQYTLSWK